MQTEESQKRKTEFLKGSFSNIGERDYPKERETRKKNWMKYEIPEMINRENTKEYYRILNTNSMNKCKQTDKR